MLAVEFTGSDTLIVAGIVALLLILILLAIAEMGLSMMTKPKAASLADQGHGAGPVLLRLVEHRERWVNPLLLTVNVCQTVQTTLTAVLAGRLFGGLGVAIGVVLNVLVFFVVAESVPKTYAALNPERAALLTARPVSLLVASAPLRVASRALIWLTNVIVKGKGLKQGPFVSEHELLGIVEAAAHDDVIEHDERELIESIIEFGDTVAREVMVPRPDMVMIPHDATTSAALDFAIEHGYSRLPVEGEDGEDVSGLAYTKDLIRAERGGEGSRPVVELVRPIHFIPENKPVRQLMREMQAGKFHLAIVADEYGAVSGLVTLEDCLEELVGEIVDEYDQEQPEVERLPSGEYLIGGGMSVSEVNDLLHIEIPDDDWDTIGGFVFNTLGRVPKLGDSTEHEGWQFIAHEVEGRRIRRLRIVVAPIDDDDDNDTRDAVDTLAERD